MAVEVSGVRDQVSGKMHLLYDLWVADVTVLERVEAWQEVLRDAAVAAGATILHERFHQFEPYGMTGFLLLAESHISVHTWPEEGYAAVDVFTCGRMNAQHVIDHLRTHLQPINEKLIVQQRGSKTPALVRHSHIPPSLESL